MAERLALKLKRRSLAAATALLVLLPGAVCAEQSRAIGSLGSNLTWNVVALPQTSQPLPQQSPARWFASAANKTKARMGVYLGQADTLPRSVVGWNHEQDIASRVRYGVYLVNLF